MIKCIEGALMLKGNAHTLLAEMATIVRGMTISLGREFGDDTPEDTAAQVCAMGIASAASADDEDSGVEVHVVINDTELKEAWEEIQKKRKENADG